MTNIWFDFLNSIYIFKESILFFYQLYLFIPFQFSRLNSNGYNYYNSLTKFSRWHFKLKMTDVYNYCKYYFSRSNWFKPINIPFLLIFPVSIILIFVYFVSEIHHRFRKYNICFVLDSSRFTISSLFKILVYAK